MRIARSLEFIAARGLATTVTGHCPPPYTTITDICPWVEVEFTVIVLLFRFTVGVVDQLYSPYS